MTFYINVMLTNIESVRNKGIFYITKYLSLIFIIEGVVLGLSALAADIPYRGLQLVEYWLYALAGWVSYRSCRKTGVIWLALVLFLAAWGVSCVEMRVITGEIDYTVFFIELIPVLLNAIRYYWLVTGKAEKLAVPPSAPKQRRYRATNKNYASSGKRASRNDGFGRGSGDPMIDEIMGRYGISERQARARVRSCQRDLDAAMDDGCMEELEDIVAEQLGDSDYTDYLI